jgi:hypothetical protein
MDRREPSGDDEPDETVGPAPSRRAEERVLRAMHEHANDVPITAIAALIHEHAEMRLLVSHGELLRGRAQISEALATGWEASAFSARVERFEWLDEQTTLTFAHARYARKDGGLAEGAVVWLDELRDGLIYRVQVFKREAQARQAYEDQQRDAADTTTPGVSDR